MSLIVKLAHTSSLGEENRRERKGGGGGGEEQCICELIGYRILTKWFR